MATAESSSTYTSTCQAASLACTTSPSQPSSAARRSRSSGQREPGAAAGAGDAAAELEAHLAQPGGVAQRRVGVGQQQVPGGRRLGRLQVGVVGREVVGVGGRVALEAGGDREQGGLQGQRALAGHEPDAHPEGLAPRPARAEPAGSRAADAAGELGLARVEGVAERRVPGELGGRDVVQLEQPAQELGTGLGRDAPALDQRHGVGQVGERQRPREPRPVAGLDGVGRGDQLVRRPSREPPAGAEVLARAHQGQPARQLGGVPPGRLGEVLGRPAEVHQADETHVVADADGLAERRPDEHPGRPPVAREAAAPGGQHRVLDRAGRGGVVLLGLLLVGRARDPHEHRRLRARQLHVAGRLDELRQGLGPEHPEAPRLGQVVVRSHARPAPGARARAPPEPPRRGSP